MIGEYLAEAPYRFSIAFGRGKFEDFWGRTAENGRILAERKKWLAEDERKYLAQTSEAKELLEEAKELGVTAATLPRDVAETTGADRLARLLGENWEPDYLVLKREQDAVRLVAGCVCFPSSWSLEEKIGRRIDEIHEIVPALNSILGSQIRTFLERIKPGVSWTRNNWGLSRSREWNQHPSRNIAKLDESVTLESVYFRVEEQSLVALPESAGVLFGIRLKVFPLAEVRNSDEIARLAELLESMPEALARYKGLGQARERIVQLLRNV